MLGANFDSIKHDLDRFINSVKFDGKTYPAIDAAWNLGKAETLSGLSQSMGLYDLAKEFNGYANTIREILHECIDKETTK